MEIETKFSSQSTKNFVEEFNSINEPIVDHLDMNVILKDLAAGSIAGIANVLSGHPFDTIKVRMQMLDTKLSACIRSIISKEGVKSFYKGVYSPLYSVPVINAIVFGSYEMSRRFLNNNTEGDMTLTQGMLAGSFAGLINCIAVTPVELIKCRQQMEGLGYKAKEITSWQMVRKIVRREGVSGLYKGNLITILREMPSYAAQFGTYELLKNYLTSIYGQSNVINFSCGAIAGFTCWGLSYPQDIIKTKLQLDFGGAVKKYSSHHLFKDGGIINCAKDIYRHEGFRGFWRGFSACTLRAMIANAFTFVAYEEAKTLFI